MQFDSSLGTVECYTDCCSNIAIVTGCESGEAHLSPSKRFKVGCHRRALVHKVGRFRLVGVKSIAGHTTCPGDSPSWAQASLAGPITTKVSKLVVVATVCSILTLASVSDGGKVVLPLL